MVAERPLLRERDVRAAERWQDGFAGHPVIVVLGNNLSQIEDLNRRYPLHLDSPITKQDLTDRLGFLVEALVAAKPFTLDPLELVAVWSRMTEVFPTKIRAAGRWPMFEQSRYRTALAGTISITHAIQVTEDLSWKQFPMTYLRSSALPEEIVIDNNGLQSVSNRLGVVRENVIELDCYAKGTREKTAAIIKAYTEGKQGALRRLEVFESFMDRRNTPVLTDMSDSFGNGAMYARSLVDTALRDLKA